MHYRPFPGAVNSRFTTKMDFLKPAEVTPIATYHVMDADSSVADPSRGLPNVTDEQVVEWYKNMVTGGLKNTFSLWHLVLTSWNNSEYYGQHHVRSPKTRPSQFLHGKYTYHSFHL